MEITFVPLISGSQTGPLGLVHLPRLWLKMRAYNRGLLPEGYRHGNGGSDEGLLTALGVDGDAFAGFIAAGEPDYPACEAWIRANAADTSAETIRAFNEHTLNFPMPEPRLSEWSRRFGLSSGTYSHGVGLNQLDDWDAMHLMLRAPHQPQTAFVPAIGSGVAGPLGVLHLPRLWLKQRLHAAGRLPEGYRHGVGGFDELVTERLGVDRDAFAAFVETEQPDYLAAEAWVRRHATKLTDEAIAGLNAHIATTKMPPEPLQKRRTELGSIAAQIELGIPLNDLDDWGGLHRQLKAVAAV